MPNSFSAQLKPIIADSLAFTSANFRQMAGLCLPILFLATVIGFHLSQIHRSTLNAVFVPFLFNLLVYPIYAAALIQLMIAKARRDNPSNGQLILLAARQWAPLFVLKLIMVVMIMAGSVLIIPGLWLWVRLSFAEFYLVAFGHSPLAAIEKSLAATKPFAWIIFSIFLSFYVPILALDLMAQSLIQMASENFYLVMLSNTLFSFLALFVLVIQFRVFMEALNKQQTGSTTSLA